MYQFTRTYTDEITFYKKEVLQQIDNQLKRYEGANHLGNVNVVFTDVPLTFGGVKYPQIVKATDYSPFGVELIGRDFTFADYRYGLNGMERDDEISGSGNSYTTFYRPYDSRLGIWKSVDPKHYINPSHTPYLGMYANPNIYTDIYGDVPTTFVDKKGNTLIDIDDGSDEIFVIEEENQSTLKTELEENALKNDLNNADYNKKLGEKYGYSIDKMLENSKYRVFSDKSSHTASYWQYGYLTGFDPEVKNVVGGIVIGFQRGGSNFFSGYKIGSKDKDEGNMNLISPEIKGNDSKWNIYKPVIEVNTEEKVIEYYSYTVRKGDNLTNIAKEYDTSIEQIASENNIDNINHIEVGKTLKIKY